MSERPSQASGFPRIALGHRDVDSFLESCLRDRVPALLFSGPEGSGKEHTAIDFARRLCCALDPKCDIEGGLCDDCRRALALEHPGIDLIYPTPTQGAGEKEGDDESDIAKILEAKREDIFAVPAFSKKVSVRIARARAVIRRANSKPFGSPYTTFIFVDAHALREEAQNALLKLVEEPPPHAVLIFITPNPDTILPTIRSRCQRVRFAPLEDRIVRRILIEYYGVSQESADAAASLSRGDIRRAHQLSSEADGEARQRAFGTLVNIAGKQESWIVEQAIMIARTTNRDSAARFLDDLAVAYRDVMTGDETLFINRDRRKALAEQVPRWDRKNIPRILDRIIEARDGILKRNLNIDAALVDLLLDIKHIG